MSCETHVYGWEASIRIGVIARAGDVKMAEKPEDLSLPASVVARIIKDAVSIYNTPPHISAVYIYSSMQLPDGVSVSKEARVAIGKAASVFILYCTAW